MESHSDFLTLNRDSEFSLSDSVWNVTGMFFTFPQILALLVAAVMARGNFELLLGNYK